MKKLYKLLFSLVFFVGALGISFKVYNNILDKKLDSAYSDSIAQFNGKNEKNKGIALQQKGLERKNLFLYGSSELSSNVPQNPTRFFPSKNYDFIINSVGRGHVQDLQHMLNFGALEELKNKKIAFVVSLQWYEDKKGIRPDSFAMNFSELQFYKFMNNKDILQESKKFVANRVYSLLKNNENYSYATLYSKLYMNDDAISKIGYYVFKPYYSIREQYLLTKDKVRALKLIKSKKNIKKEFNDKKIDWGKENIIAENIGKESTTNNKYYIENGYYAKNIKNKTYQFENRWSNVNLDESLEYNDFQQLLKVCKQLNIKPYFIIMPVNGYFYDYTGLTREKRQAFYNKIEKIVDSYGFKTLNMKEKEYEPYFMVDIMHLGWKGWLYVDEKMAEYFTKN